MSSATLQEAKAPAEVGAGGRRGFKFTTRRTPSTEHGVWEIDSRIDKTMEALQPGSFPG